jgi:hypothetical protein
MSFFVAVLSPPVQMPDSTSDEAMTASLHVLSNSLSL